MSNSIPIILSGNILGISIAERERERERDAQLQSSELYLGNHYNNILGIACIKKNTGHTYLSNFLPLFPVSFINKARNILNNIHSAKYVLNGNLRFLIFKYKFKR